MLGVLPSGALRDTLDASLCGLACGLLGTWNSHLRTHALHPQFISPQAPVPLSV